MPAIHNLAVLKPSAMFVVLLSAVDDGGRRLIDKGGGHPSYASHLLHYPDDQVTIAWATNSLHERFRADLNRRLSEAVLGVTVPK